MMTNRTIKWHCRQIGHSCLLVAVLTHVIYLYIFHCCCFHLPRVLWEVEKIMGILIKVILQLITRATHTMHEKIQFQKEKEKRE